MEGSMDTAVRAAERAHAADRDDPDAWAMLTRARAQAGLAPLCEDCRRAVATRSARCDGQCVEVQCAACHDAAIDEGHRGGNHDSHPCCLACDREARDEAPPTLWCDACGEPERSTNPVRAGMLLLWSDVKGAHREPGHACRECMLVSPSLLVVS